MSHGERFETRQIDYKTIPSYALSVAELAEKCRLVNAVAVLERILGRFAFEFCEKTG
jgi:hypothetical protein